MKEKEEEVKAMDFSSSATPKESTLTEAQKRAMVAAQKHEVKNYMERLKLSVALKELQVREIELNIKYYNLNEEYEKISEKMEEAQAKQQAKDAKAAAKKLEEIKVGKPRTEEEIKAAL